MAIQPDNSGVRFPPPLLYVAGLLAGWLLERRYPLASLPRNISIAAGIVLVVAGVLVARSAARSMWAANTSMIPVRPTTAIVSDGVYRFTRNPMYVSLVAIYVGIALLIRAPWAFLLLPLVILAVDRLVIAKEERYLETKFGEPYLAYKNRVRRWI
jgi:protein-S-isoprenylcysteine O-methyltransferase Ste14